MPYKAESNSKLIQLNAELDKTVVISEQFKQFIMSLAAAAAEEAYSVNIDIKKEEIDFGDEFINRQFIGKASVRLKCRTFAELTAKLNGSLGLSRGIGIYLGRYFPQKSGLVPLLTANFQEVVAVREWLWMEINTQTDRFAEIVGL